MLGSLGTVGALPPRFLVLRLLAISLVVGAAYDAGFAALMLGAPELPARIFDLPLPEPRFYLHLIAVFLLMLAWLYVEAAKDVNRHRAILAVAIAGRLAGAATLGWHASHGWSGLWPLAVADLAFALVHAGLAWPLFAPRRTTP